MVRSRECFTTGIADIGPLPTVSHLVLFQLGLRYEPFITKLAGKLFLFVKISEMFIEDILFLPLPF